ncbi:MAG: GAF domain-containing protein [Ignavibacteriales bacterium]
MEALSFYDELSQRNRNLEILSSLIQAVYKSFNLEEIYRVALDLIVELENVDMACIYLVNEIKNEAVMQDHRGFPEEFIQRASRIPYPKGVTWKVINTGKILNVRNAEQDPDVGPAGRDLGFRSMVGIPITLDEKTIGVIWLLSYREHVFTKSEEELLTSIGTQIAVVIARAKQTEELEERNRDLSILSAISQAVHQSVDLNRVYSNVLNIVRDLKFVDLMAVYLVEGEGEKREAVLQAHQGCPEEYLNKASRISYGRGVTWKVITGGELIYYPDASDPSTPVGPAGKALGAHALLCVPVKLGDETLGAIHFASTRKASFTEQELDFLTSLGNQIGTAIAKVKIFEEMKQQTQELKVLYETLKSAQERLVQSEKLASLGQLVSNIAHEVNNPLTPILGYSRLLLDKPGLDTERRRNAFEVIYKSAERLKKVIENLLSFSRERKAGREYVSINHLIEETLELRDYDLKLGSIEVIKNLSSELPRVVADPDQIRQVFTNIILNAEQAMVDAEIGGRLKVMTRVKGEGIVEISFADNGPGIRSEILGKVFDPFFTTKSVGKGTGLGLSISYRIIKDHGGDIYALSEEGKGATFIIELPILEEPAFNFRF